MTLRLALRAFGPGLPAAGRTVQAHFHANAVELAADGMAPLRLALDGARIEPSGFDGSHWAIDLQQEQAAWRLQLDSPQAIAALQAQPPPALAVAVAACAQRHRRQGRWRLLGIGGLGLWLAAPVLLLILVVALAGPLTALVAARVPVAVEQKLGQQLFTVYRGQLRLVEDGPALETVQQLGGKLTQGSAYRYQWYLVQDPSLNAFAMPGGIVVVHTGLIAAAQRAEELAGVLAHEIQHVEQRHSLRALAHEAGLSLLVGLVLGDMSTAGGIAGKLGSLGFSRDNERDADRRAVPTLIAAGIDPRGLIGMFETMRQDAGPSPPAFLSTHPATDQRIAELAELTREAPRLRPLDIDWPAIVGSLEAAPAAP